MRKILIVCNTYYQLILAIHMATTIMKDAEVSVGLSDHSKNAHQVYLRLKEQSVFRHVYYLKTKRNGAYGLKEKLHETITSIFGGSDFADFCEPYDEVIYYNPIMSTHMLFADLYRLNPKIKCNRMEEGLASCRTQMVVSKKIRLIYACRKWLGKTNLAPLEEKFYCFYPEVYAGSLAPVRIPLINETSAVCDVLKQIFPVREQGYHQKYIFFTSVFDFEGGQPIGEYALAERIADLVGKENLLIKQHPRDTRTIYKEAGFQVDQNSDLPWEAIQLCHDFSQKVLLSVNSGCLLSANLLTEKGARACYLYRLCDLSGNQLAQTVIPTLDEQLRIPALARQIKKVSVVNKIEEIQ